MTDSRKHIVGPTERRETLRTRLRILAQILEQGSYNEQPGVRTWRTDGANDIREWLAETAKADAILASDGEVVTSRPVCLPEGWVAVPIEATEEMRVRGAMASVPCGFITEGGEELTAPFPLELGGPHKIERAEEFVGLIYAEMLAQAPPLPEPTQDGSPQQTSASDGGRELVRELIEACEPLAIVPASALMRTEG